MLASGEKLAEKLTGLRRDVGCNLQNSEQEMLLTEP